MNNRYASNLDRYTRLRTCRFVLDWAPSTKGRQHYGHRSDDPRLEMVLRQA
jgi:hypothetical protein